MCRASTSPDCLNRKLPSAGAKLVGESVSPLDGKQAEFCHELQPLGADVELRRGSSQALAWLPYFNDHKDLAQAVVACRGLATLVN